MNVITYYNLSHDKSPCDLSDGSILLLDNLLSVAASSQVAKGLFPGLSSTFSVKDLDPLGIKNPKKWEDYMGLLIWSISGKVPLRQEVLRGRQILHQLPSWFKKNTNLHQFSFALLPYILIGFKSHLEKRFISDSNNLSDIIEFILRLSRTPHQIFESFLCAHRQKDGEKKFHLVDDIHILKTQAGLNLSVAILTNNPWSKSRVVQWFQQGASEFACLNMFPEMFLRYLVFGEIPELLRKLDRHLLQIGGMMSAGGSDKVLTQVHGADGRSLAVLQCIADRYGPSWKSVDFSSAQFSKDPLVGIAISDTLPLVYRLTPFYSNQELYTECLKKKEVYIKQNALRSKESASGFSAELVESVIEKFYEIQCMHPTAKALYETVFYYVWGEHSRSNNTFSIGIDRDHAEFQYNAWNLGFSLGETEFDASPLVYARRSTEGKDSLFLKDFSIRQFWR